MKTKQCSKCKEEKSLDAFSTNKTAKDGKAYWCKECCAYSARERTKAYRERKDFEIDWSATKRCSWCEKEQTATEFYINLNKKDGLHNICKECDHKSCRRWNANNQDKINEYNKQWYADNAEAMKEWRKRYYQENPEKVAESNRNWRKSNPEKCRAYVSNRKARKLKLDDGTLTAKALTVLLQVTDYCPCCGIKMTDEKGPHKKNISHMIPLNKGGIHGTSNVMISCRTCNLTMHDQLLTEWTGIPGDRAHDIYEFLAEVA